MKIAVRYFTKTGNTKKLAALHSGHPDDDDIKAVRAFAREVTGDA